MSKISATQAAQQETATPSSAEQSAIRKISLRLVPFVGLMFFINFLDRTAISFAGPNGMNTDLALAFFLTTIISGFQQQFGTTFNVLEKGLITAVPYLPAAIVMHFWSRDATRRGCRTWHIAIPALTGAISIPLALYMESPAATIAVITVTACSIFSALPNFWTLPTQFLTGAPAAAAIALINTIGNVAGFSAGYITGVLQAPTFSLC